jgi:hypothetical protein
MKEVSIIGLDLAKYVFQVHGASADGAVVFRRKLRRGQILSFFAGQPACTVANRRQAFARHVVDDVEHAESPPAGELIVHEVERPAGVRSRLDEDRRPGSDSPATRPALAHGQPFFPVYAIDPVDPGRLSFAAQQDEQPPVAEAPPPAGEIAQLLPQLQLGRPPRPVADRGAIGGDDGAGPTLRQAHRGLQMRDGFALADKFTQSAQA